MGLDWGSKCSSYARVSQVRCSIQQRRVIALRSLRARDRQIQILKKIAAECHISAALAPNGGCLSIIFSP